ncbi:MAG: nicotinate-nucleotide adenylyltransferase [Clostridia bacterium]|nr:nicotinate-nucleotide adenylyltransferase [Clostridia bacterium]
MKIGIFGGSFDPVHMGHLVLAEHVREGAGLDSLILMPAWKSPFKVGNGGASGIDRLEMTRLAAADNERISVSSYEVDLGKVSYTVDTLRELRKDYRPEDKLYFILGGDSFLTLEKWAGADELLSEYGFAVGRRPGSGDGELQECAERLRSKYGTEVIMTDVPQLDISSTDIRERVKEGRDIRYLVPRSVEDYIREHGLYRD